MRIEIIIAIAAPILAFAGAMFGHLISARSARKDRKQQLAMAALDKRLAVHQEAFYHWHRVSSSLNNTDDLRQSVAEAEVWLPQNHLYLDTDTSKEFFTCIQRASNYPELLEEYRRSVSKGHEDKSLAKLIEENSTKIEKVGGVIRAAIYRLPPPVNLNI